MGVNSQTFIFPLKQSQLSGFILFCDNFDCSNITCIVFLSVYIFSFFRPYTYVIIVVCGELRLFLSLSGIRLLFSISVASYVFYFLDPYISFILNVCGEFGFLSACYSPDTDSAYVHVPFGDESILGLNIPF